MCNACDRVRGGIREEPLTANEIQMLKLLQKKPPAKLAAMLPAYVKTHLSKAAPPKTFVFKAHAAPVFPSYLTKQLATPRAFPSGEENLRQYIRAYEELNHLTTVSYIGD